MTEHQKLREKVLTASIKNGRLLKKERTIHMTTEFS
jgi:hypothetical protein